MVHLLSICVTGMFLYSFARVAGSLASTRGDHVTPSLADAVVFALLVGVRVTLFFFLRGAWVDIAWSALVVLSAVLARSVAERRRDGQGLPL